MKKNIFFLVIFILVASAIFACAQEYNKHNATIEVGPGMETTKVGNVNVIAPKGTKLREEQGVVYIEDAGAYAARKFEDMEKRLVALEAKQEELLKEVEELRQAVDNVKNTTNIF